MTPAVAARPGGTPTPPWTMSRHASEVYTDLGPIAAPDAENGFALAILIDAWCTVMGWLDDACRPEGDDPPWAQVLDPDRCPWWALQWCGQLYGVRLTPSLGPWQRPDAATEAAWRQEIRERPRWRRGSVQAIRAAAQQCMVGDRRVKIRERYNGVDPDAPYHLAVSVRLSDLAPGTDHAAVERAVLAAIPAGLVATVEITDNATYDDRRDAHANYAALPTVYSDYDDLRDAA